jgi:hypothetical protein
MDRNGRALKLETDEVTDVRYHSKMCNHLKGIFGPRSVEPRSAEAVRVWQYFILFLTCQ